MHARSLIVALWLTASLAAAEPDTEGFVPMFNGKDLSGWTNVNCHPDTFFVKDGMIVTNGNPTGYLRTAKQYENFIAEFDWMHIPSKPGAVGNSGFFDAGKMKDKAPVLVPAPAKATNAEVASAPPPLRRRSTDVGMNYISHTKH